LSNRGKTWEWFISNFEQMSKIDLTLYKRPQMERRINSFMRSVDADDYGEFIQILKADKDIFERFVQHITINVSEFFRNNNNWQILVSKIIPELRKEQKSLKIWSAGCSTGEEAYSLAMLAKANNIPLNGSILATDLDEGVLEKAKIGLYSSRAVEGISPDYLKKYFTRQGETYQINDEIKQMVNFKQQDLLKDTFDKSLDLILCRNVVIYFTEHSKNLLYKKFAAALRAGGVLFIGSTEQIFQASELDLLSVKTFFYQKNDTLVKQEVEKKRWYMK